MSGVENCENAAIEFPECIYIDRLAIPPERNRWKFAVRAPLSVRDWHTAEDEVVAFPTIREVEYERDFIWPWLWWRIK